MKQITCLFIALVSYYKVSAQHSRMSVELIGFIDEHFSYFNKATLPTTSDRFKGVTPFGGMYTKNNPSMFQYQPNNVSLNIEQALLINYKLDPHWSLRYGVIFSYAGSSNAPSGVLGIYTGSSNRMFRFSMLPTYQFYNNTTHKITASFSLGASIDYVRDDWGEPSFYANPKDSFMFRHETVLMQSFSTSLHTGVRIRFELKNGNGVGFHAMGGLGLMPVIKNTYEYMLSGNNYYTEMYSNGSYLRIGIGYEFQIMRKKFRYQPIKK